MQKTKTIETQTLDIMTKEMVTQTSHREITQAAIVPKHVLLNNDYTDQDAKSLPRRQ